MQRDVIEPAGGFFSPFNFGTCIFARFENMKFHSRELRVVSYGIAMHGFMALTILQWKRRMNMICELLFSKVVIMEMIPKAFMYYY